MSPVALSRSVLAAAPGRDAGCDVLVTNPTAGALAVAVGVEGPAAEWSMVLPPSLVVSPGGSARARVTFTVPDGARLAGSTREFAVRVAGGATAALPGRLEIPDVQDLRVSIHPLLARGRGPTAHTVTLENRGTSTARAALVAGGDLDVRLGEAQVSVASGETATVDVTVTPRRRFHTGRSRPHVVTVEARPETGLPVTARATRFEDPVRWRRGVLAALMALTVAAAGVGVLRTGRAPKGAPLAPMAATPVMPLALASGCPVTGTADPPRLDIARFAYCPATRTVAAGTEVTWANADLAPHTVTYDGPDGPVDSGSMVQGQSWSTRFDQAGTYRYYCRFHPGMAGTIVVESSR